MARNLARAAFWVALILHPSMEGMAIAGYERGVADERERLGLPALVPAARRPDREAAPA